MTRRRHVSFEDDEDFDSVAPPWEPLWEFVLGDDEYSTSNDEEYEGRDDLDDGISRSVTEVDSQSAQSEISDVPQPKMGSLLGRMPRYDQSRGKSSQVESSTHVAKKKSETPRSGDSRDTGSEEKDVIKLDTLQSKPACLKREIVASTPKKTETDVSRSCRSSLVSQKPTRIHTLKSKKTKIRPKKFWKRKEQPVKSYNYIQSYDDEDANVLLPLKKAGKPTRLSRVFGRHHQTTKKVATSTKPAKQRSLAPVPPPPQEVVEIKSSRGSRGSDPPKLASQFGTAHTQSFEGDSALFTLGSFFGFGTAVSDSTEDTESQIRDDPSHISEETSAITEDDYFRDHGVDMKRKETRKPKGSLGLSFEPLLQYRGNLLPAISETDEANSPRLGKERSKIIKSRESDLSRSQKVDDDVSTKDLSSSSSVRPDVEVNEVVDDISCATSATSGSQRSKSQSSKTKNVVVCCSVKDASANGVDVGTKRPARILELSDAERGTLFPKLRSVVDSKAEEMGNSTLYDTLMPAHLQAILKTRAKPQSLLEYEYDKGKPMCVNYRSHGLDAEQLVRLNNTPKMNEIPLGTSEVMIQVEASTVSLTDCYIRKGLWWRNDPVPLPVVPGIDVVGRVCRIDSMSAKKFKLHTGDRIATLCKWGGNSRFLHVDPDQVVHVPNEVDPAAAACIVETYLACFQTMFRGLIKGKRYRRGSLRGKAILLMGCVDSKFAAAVAQLAKFSGVKRVYISAKKKKFEQLQTFGLHPVDRDDQSWINTMRNQVDAIISFEQTVTPEQYEMLTKNGEITLVCCGDLKIEARMKQPSGKLVCRRSSEQQASRTQTYDIFKTWEEDLEQSKQDLTHLMKLLKLGAIQPHVLDRIPLAKVGKAQGIVGAKKLSGFIVCEPWLVFKSRAIRL